jgi:hypothetical protein
MEQESRRIRESLAHNAAGAVWKELSNHQPVLQSIRKAGYVGDAARWILSN